MADNVTKAQRSYVMSRIRKKDTKPEIIVRKYLFSHGFRYRLHVSQLPGSPDIVLPKCKVAIFVQGCFWHKHNSCRLATLLKSRQDYWIPKIMRNKARDEVNRVSLVAMGWKVLALFECELRAKQAASTSGNLLSDLRKIQADSQLA